MNHDRLANAALAVASLFLSLGLSFAAPASAGDWPQFKRSADRQGCDLTEQVALPAKLCSWFDFGSPIRASAAVVGGKAYAVSNRGLLARIDLAGNKVDWQRNLGGVNNESCPAVAGGKVYVGSTAGKFFVLDAETGAVLKEHAAGAPVLASPLLHKDAVYFGSTDGVFHALDLAGEPKWTFKVANKTAPGAAADASSLILLSAAAENDLIVFPAGLGHIYWLRDQGKKAEEAFVYRWPIVPNVGGNTAVGAPTIHGGSVYVGMTGQEEPGSLFKFPLTGGDRKSVKVATVRTSPSVDSETGMLFFGSSTSGMWAMGGSGDWRVGPLSGVNSSAAVVKNCVIFGDESGALNFCKKARDPGGAQLLWSFTLPSGKAIEASPAVSGGKVVVGSLDGCLYGFWDGPEVKKPVKVAP
ncbi:MAG TPA: PQQ-binding-like beta-propeller repeat protein [Planctomycetota bacterium]|nr:PQQ-binding-like beta-propeller repeat protein [Planctomycetota bacterium]